MKRNIIKIFIMVPMIFATLASCSDYLDLEPKDDLIQQEFWNNKEQVSSAVAGCYASMNQSGFTDRVLKWGEFRAEMMVSSGGGLENIMKNYMVPSDGLTNWSTFYATINYCNLVLEFSDDAQAQDKTFSIAELNTFKAEAITIRSLAYLILVKNFKEVPLVLTATATNQINFYPAKNTEQEVLDQIISDLTSAVDDLNLGYSESPAHDKGRMTKGAALAILADAYLWNEQYTECITATQSLIDLGRYSLVDGDEWFNSIFFEGNSSEGIFELQFSDISSTLRNSFQLGGNYVAYQGIAELYMEFPDDIRGNLATFDLNTNTVFKYAGVDQTGEYRGSDEYYNNFIFYRYADVLLMQAEAYILSAENKNLDQANTLISQVHERAVGIPLGVTIDEVSLLNALLLERQKEFAFEGKRWYDLLRFARRDNFQDQDLIINLVDFKSGADDYEQILSYYSDSDSYFLPIYQSELDLNDNLVQNPYYDN
ncbi:RagB/SusD family nutrient uptake outer membrane protein [Algibacter sp. L4_22]|uniref:RagB/SusD family nutrient uptake outer membrane protein n=1 Tax=Algibacter sp. L4_22 TaxID=2942477 RepID=UPI00201B679B|nr:RagB/SusD family nutrient uptake outer membrane protein [Algibacter sp. L4_22]MCL5129806.1 RagB/SusD family nutrient uptake outer membrane protein [Algibacter sp. L4_22]